MRGRSFVVLVLFLCAVVIIGFGALADETLGYLNGFVHSEEGIAVAGALVTVVPVDEDGGYAPSDEEGRFDADWTQESGAFEVAVIPGPYRLVVEADGFLSASIDVEVYQGVSFIDQITLQRGGSIAGSVYGADGVTPVEGAAIVATSGIEDYYVAFSNADGSYLIEGLPEGEYTVTAAYGLNLGELADRVSVRANESSIGITFQLVSGAFQASAPHADNATITGFVRWAETGAPAVGAVIGLANAEGEAIEIGVKRTTDDGAFSIDGLAAGTYQVTARLEDYVSVFVDGVVAEKDSVTSGIEIFILSGAGSLQGQITNTQGEPIGGALVMLLSENWSQLTITASDGSFLLENLPGGVATLAAFTEGFEQTAVEGIQISDGLSMNLVLEADGNGG
jgi:hypothetical protein